MWEFQNYINFKTKNIFESGKLDENSVVKESLTTALEVIRFD